MVSEKQSDIETRCKQKLDQKITLVHIAIAPCVWIEHKREGNQAFLLVETI